MKKNRKVPKIETGMASRGNKKWERKVLKGNKKQPLRLQWRRANQQVFSTTFIHRNLYNSKRNSNGTFYNSNISRKRNFFQFVPSTCILLPPFAVLRAFAFPGRPWVKLSRHESPFFPVKTNEIALKMLKFCPSSTSPPTFFLR